MADEGWGTLTWALAIWMASGAVVVGLFTGGAPQVKKEGTREDVESALNPRLESQHDVEASVLERRTSKIKESANYSLGPVDVERQCGVMLPNGQPCAKSLTCKSHSMGAKRAITGRSLPYDMLLAAFQEKNRARRQGKQCHLLPVTSSLTMSQRLLPTLVARLRTTMTRTPARRCHGDKQQQLNLLSIMNIEGTSHLRVGRQQGTRS